MTAQDTTSTCPALALLVSDLLLRALLQWLSHCGPARRLCMLAQHFHNLQALSALTGRRLGLMRTSWICLAIAISQELCHQLLLTGMWRPCCLAAPG